MLLPSVNVEEAIQEDLAAGIYIPRFGVKIPTSFEKGDGVLTSLGEQVCWHKSFKAQGAKSLNYFLSDLHLPLNGQLFVFNASKTMILGPVEAEHIVDGKFATDIVDGEQSTIAVFMTQDSLQNFSIKITSIIHGYNNPTVEYRDFGNALSCHVDVNCPTGTSFTTERDATALIIVNGLWNCSGTLINNVCQDFKPYLLTAEHCLISSTFADWVFRFNYDSPDPTPPLCHGSEPQSTIFFSGATLRVSQKLFLNLPASSTSSSEFALFELFQPITGTENLAVAGWDRKTALPTNGVGIHHPIGDVKKISTGSNTFVECGINPGFSPNLLGESHFQLKYSSGTTQKGSSGSSFFESNKIVGINTSGNGQCPHDYATYGKFSLAWIGGGALNNSLSPWLGSKITTPLSLNSIRVPAILGSTIICNVAQNTNFQLTGVSNAGQGITWEVTPSNLFATTGGAAISGTGLIATIRPKPSVSAYATVSFRVQNTPCGSSYLVKKKFWIGTASFSLSVSPTSLCYNNNSVPIDAELVFTNASAKQQFVSSIVWNASGALIGASQSTNTTIFQAKAGQLGTGIISVSITNQCGISTASSIVVVHECNNDDPPAKIIASPNPSSGKFSIQIENFWQNLATSRIDQVPTTNWVLFDAFGKLKAHGMIDSEKFEIEGESFQNGIYQLVIFNSKFRVHEKITIAR